MLSKGSAAALPLVLLLIVWWERRRITAIDLLRTAPFFAIAIVLTWVNVWFRTHGTDVVIRDAGFGERLAGAGAGIWFYLSKSFLPIDLLLVYPQWHISTREFLWWIPVLGVAVTTIVLWRQSNSPSPGWSRPVLFAWLYFCLSLVPVLGFIDVGFMRYALVADHYQHLALIGVVTLAAAVWSTWYQRPGGAADAPAMTVGLIALGLLMLLAWRQSRLFGDPTKLYQATLEKNPDSALVHNNLGVRLFDAGQRQEGIEQYQAALQLNPDDDLAYVNLGNALSATGHLSEAIDDYRKALSLKPDSPEAHSNLGRALDASGKRQEAIAEYQTALKLRPNFPEAHNNLGVIYENSHAMPQAIEQYLEALWWRPGFPEAHSNLAHALLQMGRFREAIEHYREAVRLTPDSPTAHNDLGLALMNAARPHQAVEEFQQALQLKHDYALALANMAIALDQLKRSAEAMAAAQAALHLARTQNQEALAKEVEEWLKNFQTSHPELSQQPPAK